MEPNEFDQLMNDLNGAYKTFELNPNRLSIWEEKLINFNFEISKRAINNIVTNSKYAPTISDFSTEYANVKMYLRRKINPEDKVIDCNICKGDGFISLKIKSVDGIKYDYVAKCRCVAGENYKHCHMLTSAEYDELEMSTGKEVYPGFVECNNQQKIPFSEVVKGVWT